MSKLGYEELFMQADKALYIAHEKGHNRYVIYDVEKHGAVQPNRARDYSDLYAAPPVQSNAGFTADLVQEYLHGNPEMQSVLQRIGAQFGLDGIQIFTAPDWQPAFSWGHPFAGDASLLTAEPFAQHYNADRVCVIDNINALEGIDDAVYARLANENLLGAVLYLAEQDGKPAALAAFGLYGRFRKWSNLDISHLTILGSMLTAGL